MSALQTLRVESYTLQVTLQVWDTFQNLRPLLLLGNAPLFCLTQQKTLEITEVFF